MKKPKKPGDLIRKANAKKHKSSPANPYETEIAKDYNRRQAIQPKFARPNSSSSRPTKILSSLVTLKKKKAKKHSKKHKAGVHCKGC